MKFTRNGYIQIILEKDFQNNNFYKISIIDTGCGFT